MAAGTEMMRFVAVLMSLILVACAPGPMSADEFACRLITELHVVVYREAFAPSEEVENTITSSLDELRGLEGSIEDQDLRVAVRDLIGATEEMRTGETSSKVYERHARAIHRVTAEC